MTTKHNATWLTVDQAAAAAGVGRETVYRWLKQGLPSSLRRWQGIRTRREVRPQDLHAWLERATIEEGDGEGSEG